MSRAWRRVVRELFQPRCWYLVETVDQHIGGALALEDVHQHLVSALVTNRDRVGERLWQHDAMSESRLSKKLQRSLLLAQQRRQPCACGTKSWLSLRAIQTTSIYRPICRTPSRVRQSPVWSRLSRSERLIWRFEPSPRQTRRTTWLGVSWRPRTTARQARFGAGRVDCAVPATCRSCRRSGPCRVRRRSRSCPSVRRRHRPCRFQRRRRSNVAGPAIQGVVAGRPEDGVGAAPP